MVVASHSADEAPEGLAQSRMDIDEARKLLWEVALGPAKPDDSQELQALRKISRALAHLAEGIAEIRRTQAAMIMHPRNIRRSPPRKRGNPLAG